MESRTRIRLWRRVGGLLLGVTSTLLVSNSLFLYTTDRPDGLVGGMLRIHVWLGYTFCGALMLFVVPHFLLQWGHRNQRARRWGYGVAGMLGCGCAMGVWLHLRGRLPDSQWLVQAHEMAFILGLIVYLIHRLVARTTSVFNYEFAGAVLVIVLFAGIWSAGGSPGDGIRARSGSVLTDVRKAVTVTDFGASRIGTVTGHWLNEDDLRNSDYCAQCHSEIAEQWNGSAHRFSSLNDPFYEKTFEAMQRHRPPEAAKFCGGCHDPLVLLTGHMEQTVTAETVNAQEGITCLLCHGIVELRDRVGNAGFLVAAPDHYPYFGSDDPVEREINLQLIRAKPQKHKESFLKDFHRTSEFCLPCHKAHLDITVNRNRWKRGQNDYDAWHDSAAGMKSALTFYNAEKPQRCQDCHMPDIPTQDPAARDGFTRDHSFASANTALAQHVGNDEWMRKAQQMLRDCVSVDIFSAVIDPEGPEAIRIFPVEKSGVVVPAGRPVRLEVLVRNRKVGHLFPGGTIDLNEAWLEFTVSEENRVTLASGLLDSTGRLDPTAHRFHNIMLTREGRLVDIHNVEDFHTVLYNNALPLGPADVIRFDFVVPERPGLSAISLTARVQYRKFSRPYTEFALGPDAPPLPVTLISEDTVELKIGPRFEEGNSTESPELALRLNDFGIAHLRQGDTRTAIWAFQRVAQLDPTYPDAFVNLARCYLEEGNLPALEAALRRADALRPGYFKAAYFLGRLRAARGQFEDAVAAFDVTLASFPDDREVLNQKGAALVKLERFEEAIAVFERTLRIDPENVTAHSYLFRCYKSLDNPARASVHEREYLRYRTEESEKTVAEIYRRNDPNADREANPQHVHPLNPVEPSAVVSQVRFTRDRAP